MKSYCLQLNKSTIFYFCEAFDILSSAILYWSGASRIDMCLNLLDGSSYNSNI